MSTQPTTDALVRQMRTTFDLPVNDGTPALPSPAQLRLHFKLLGEEFAEFAEALFGVHARKEIDQAVAKTLTYLTGDADLVLAADALGDVVIVSHGAAQHFGVPLDEVIREQMRANLSKVDDDGRPVFNADGKFIKEGTNYVPPNVALVIAQTEITRTLAGTQRRPLTLEPIDLHLPGKQRALTLEPVRQDATLPSATS